MAFVPGGRSMLRNAFWESDMLVRVLYVSSIRSDMTSSDIERLTVGARRRNRQLDLTGALLVCDGHFVQALEGRESVVEEMMRKISLDPRHHELHVQDRSVITQRLFADWDMALVYESTCLPALHDLLAGRIAVADFLSTMTAWIEDNRIAPR